MRNLVMMMVAVEAMPSRRGLTRMSVKPLGVRGGKDPDDVIDGNWDMFRRQDDRYEQQQPREQPQPRYQEEQRYAREWQPPQSLPVIVQSGSTGSGGLVALIVAMTATLAGGAVWLLARPAGGNSTRPKSVEAVYAESVASLEAQLHRLSVDRQMLADEFAEARKSLETQIADVETEKAQATEAVEASDQAMREAKASAVALADRLKAQVAVTERLRDEKARAEAALDSLRHRVRPLVSSIVTLFRL